MIMIGGQIGKIAKIDIEADRFFGQISEFVSKLSLAHTDPKKMMEAVPANEQCGRKLVTAK